MDHGSDDRRGFLKRLLGAMAGMMATPFTAWPQTPRPIPRNNTQDERLVREFFDQVFNRGNTTLLNSHEVAEQHCADEFHIALARQNPGRPAPNFGQVVANLRGAMPDLHFEIQDVTPAGDELWVRWVAQGTHRGELYGFKATGRKVSIEGTSRVTVTSGGKITHMLQTYSASMHSKFTS